MTAPLRAAPSFLQNRASAGNGRRSRRVIVRNGYLKGPSKHFRLLPFLASTYQQDEVEKTKKQKILLPFLRKKTGSRLSDFRTCASAAAISRNRRPLFRCRRLVLDRCFDARFALHAEWTARPIREHITNDAVGQEDLWFSSLAEDAALRGQLLRTGRSP
jgi:hypothetical protein